MWYWARVQGWHLTESRCTPGPLAKETGHRSANLPKKEAIPPSFAALQLGPPGHALFRRMERVGARFTARQELRAPVGSVQTEPWPGYGDERRREETRGERGWPTFNLVAPPNCIQTHQTLRPYPRPPCVSAKPRVLAVLGCPCPTDAFGQWAGPGGSQLGAAELYKPLQASDVLLH